MNKAKSQLVNSCHSYLLSYRILNDIPLIFVVARLDRDVGYLTDMFATAT